MGGPSWLAWIFASVMIAIAVYCLTRLLVSWRQHRPTDRPVDLAHVLMGVAMAGMLVARLRVFWVGGWEVVFGIGTVWFAGLTIREHRGQATVGGRSGHHLQHVLACGAMLYMFLAKAAVAKAAAVVGGAAIGGMAAGPAHFPTLALALAFALFGYVVWNADRLSSLAPVAALAARAVPVPVLAGAGKGGGASFAAAHRQTTSPAHREDPSAAHREDPSATRQVPLSPRLAVCCEIVMGVTMGYVLILML
ncbi:MAG: DUF5134 domain-containing protein [Streptosporangiaceae bacterium]|jgi:hypothetical protein